MKNYINSGERMPIVAPVGGVVSGQALLVGAKVCVAFDTAIAGATVVVATEGVFELPKVTGTAIAQGAKVYWDDTAKLFTSVVSTNTLCGYAFAAAASADATIQVNIFDN